MLDDGMSHQARMLRYDAVSTALARLGDRRLAASVAGARTLGSGVGGASALLEVAGLPVFVKRIPLTGLELEPGNVMSTANLFGLPTFCHYGVVALPAAGFGAWRELAANTMTTGWVLAGQAQAFALMYHWRVLPGAPPPPVEHADVDKVVAYWDGSAAVGRRLHALARASASLVLFLEYIPQTLSAWLAGRLAAGPGEVAAACAMVHRRLRYDIAFMNGNGLLHFDAHFRNILTDGHRLYLADLGLAGSPRFDLTAGERDFLDHNASHDTGYAARELLNWIVANVAGIAGTSERHDYIRRCASGARPTGVPAPIAGLVSRHAPAAAVMNDFYWKFFGESRTTPYPGRAVASAVGEREFFRGDEQMQ